MVALRNVGIVYNLSFGQWKWHQCTNFLRSEVVYMNHDLSQDRNNPCKPPGPWRWRACKHYRARLTKTGPHPSKNKIFSSILLPEGGVLVFSVENKKHPEWSPISKTCLTFSVAASLPELFASKLGTEFVKNIPFRPFPWILKIGKKQKIPTFF